MLTLLLVAGVRPARGGDDHLYAAHRPFAVHLEEKALQLHIGKSNRRKITVWHEGILFLILEASGILGILTASR